LWNNPRVESTRLRRAVNNGLWAFAITLIVASSWGFWRTLPSVQHTLREFAAAQHHLNQLESALVQMERCLLGLAHADSPKVRYVGYDPEHLQANLTLAYREADAAVHTLLAELSGVHDLAFQEQLIRLELEWAQTRSRLAEYLTTAKPEQISLSALRTFSFRGQDTLGEAIHGFKRAYQEQVEREIRGGLHALIGSVAGLWMGFGIIIGLMWGRWARPVRWLRRALTQSTLEPVAPPPLRGTEWEPLYQKLAFQERRLREVELFMRDLAMGRTPEPIAPTDPTDALARSSGWLLKRFDELRSQRREAV